MEQAFLIACGTLQLGVWHFGLWLALDCMFLVISGIRSSGDIRFGTRQRGELDF